MLRSFALTAMLTALFLPFAARGAEINRSWDTLAGSIKTGKKVAVILMNSSSVEGKLLAIDSHSVTVQEAAGSRTIAAADIFRVRYAGTRRRHALYGMLLGMPVGAISTWAVDKKSDKPQPGEAAIMGAILFGLPGGAIAGAAMPIGPTLYEAEKVVRKAP